MENVLFSLPIYEAKVTGNVPFLLYGYGFIYLYNKNWGFL